MKEIYFKNLNVDNREAVLNLFYDSLIETNRSFDFFVNWEKIRSYFDEYKIELNILNSLINDPNFDDTLTKILHDYPNVLPVIPLLIAVRDKKFPIVSNFNSEELKNYRFDFSVRQLSFDEINFLIEFISKTGLKDFFLSLSQKSIPDYYIGVEVGMDTNARKNRSGQVMEEFIHSKLKEIKRKTNDSFGIFTQSQYNILSQKYGLKINSALSNRKADFILVKNNRKIIAIETNFYSGTGSKPQEIVNSYIQRQNELKKYDIDFIWITDGIAWVGQKNQMNFGFERLDYILNISFIKKGLLENIISSI